MGCQRCDDRRCSTDGHGAGPPGGRGRGRLGPPSRGHAAPLGATPLAPRQVCVPGSVLGPRVVRPCQSRALDTSLSVSSPQSPVAGGG